MMLESRMVEILSDVHDQLRKACQKHAPMNSPLEGIAVIREEFRELRDEAERQIIDSEALRREALHTAAMAVRFILDICPDRRWIVQEHAPAMNAPEYPLWAVIDSTTMQVEVGDVFRSKIVALRQAQLYNIQGGPTYLGQGKL